MHIDTGEIASEVRRRVPGGVQHLLDLVGTVTLRDSLRAVAPQGLVCNSGILGNAWTFPDFEPMEDIPSTVRLTTYSSGTLTAANGTAALQRIVDGVAAGRYPAQPARVFHLDEIVEAHRTMEEHRVSGKLVVATECMRHLLRRNLLHPPMRRAYHLHPLAQRYPYRRIARPEQRHRLRPHQSRQVRHA